MAKIFISYRRNDSRNITDRIYDHLKRNFTSYEVFKDVNSIPVGTDFPDYINKTLSSAEVVVLVIGKNWSKSFSERSESEDFVRQEVLAALSMNKNIIPVFVEGNKGLGLNELPEDINSIAKLNGIEVRPDPDFDNDMKKLYEIILQKLTTKKIYKPENKKQSFFNATNIGIVAIIVLILSGIGYFITRETCDYPKKGILIANFLEKEHDGFSNTLVVNLDKVLSDSIYDVRPVGAQTREIKNYSQAIDEKYFDSECLPSGFFVNGFIDKEDEVFNMYTNIVRMEIKYPELMADKSIILSNPEKIEFSIREDAKFVSDFLLALIAMYEGDSQQALKTFGKLEENQKVNLNDPEFLSTLAFYKGNCYALRGDEKMARAEYKKVKKSENPALINHALRNEGKADEISIKYQNDPEYSQLRIKNIKENDVIEDEILKTLGKNLNKFEKNLLKKVLNR